MNVGPVGFTSSTALRDTLGAGAIIAAARGVDKPCTSEDPSFEGMANVLDDIAVVVSCLVSAKCPCAKPCARPCVDVAVHVAEVIITPESFRSSWFDDDSSFDSGSLSRKASRMPCTRPEWVPFSL